MGYIFTSLLIFIFSQTEKPLAGKNILFVIAHKRFNDKEYQLPRELLERVGAKVTVASTDTSIAVGMYDLEVKPDTLISQISKIGFDGVVFIGGMGAREYWDDTTAHNIVKNAFKEKKVIGAIYISPIILAKAKILRFKSATVWENSETKHILKQEQVRYINNPVVTSDKIVTANGPVAAKEFAEKIIELLLKEKESPDTPKRSTSKKGKK